MRREKSFRKSTVELESLVPGYGACFATDHITLIGHPVGYMYREPPVDEYDSGWRFFSGNEDDAYLADPDNVAIYDVNTIANYDPDIIKFLDAPIGAELERNASGTFVLIQGRSL